MILPVLIIVLAQILALYMAKSQKKARAYVAFDLGAESGRVIIGCLCSGKLEIREIYRFPNRGVRVGDSLFWDVLSLWEEMKHGLSLALKENDVELYSLGVDTWGVDFALLDGNDVLLGNPHSYRDQRTNGMVEAASILFSPFDVFQQTGNQVMPINSLYQLIAMKKGGSYQLAQAKIFLTMPDLFNFWFSGKKVSEFTIASTTQCLNLQENKWAKRLLEIFELSPEIFQPIILPGTILGELRKDLSEEMHTGNIKVIAVASHDTQSAILAVPAENDDHLYLSSGTWSLMGIETDKPLINKEVFESNFTNEGSFGGKYCLLKNIAGLWLLQECRRNWTAEGNAFTYEELTELASQAIAFSSLIDPTDPTFISPGNMIGRIKEYCRQSGQTIPETPAAITRCILESLVMEYRSVTDQLAAISGHNFPVIHVIGGGSRNRLLNQFTANATGRKVIAGPAEATAIGNILVQMISAGQIKSISDARDIVRRSFCVEEFTPESASVWDAAYLRFLEIRKGL